MSNCPQATPRDLYCKSPRMMITVTMMITDRIPKAIYALFHQNRKWNFIQQKINPPKGKASMKKSIGIKYQLNVYRLFVPLDRQCNYDGDEDHVKVCVCFWVVGKNAVKEAASPSNNHKTEPPQMGMVTFRDWGYHLPIFLDHNLFGNTICLIFLSRLAQQDMDG